MPTAPPSPHPSRWWAISSARAGAVAALVGIGAIREGVIPPTINLDNPDLPECDLDYVPKVARKTRVDTAMVNGFGFGGQNAVAVFRRFEA